MQNNGTQFAGLATLQYDSKYDNGTVNIVLLQNLFLQNAQLLGKQQQPIAQTIW